MQMGFGLSGVKPGLVGMQEWRFVPKDLLNAPALPAGAANLN